MNPRTGAIQHSFRQLRRALTLVAALTLLRPVHAQVSGVRRSPEARVDDVFAAYNRSDTPGCAVGVTRDGRLEYSRGYGLADVVTGQPITPTTPFYAASASKQFTAFAVLLLAEEGRLSLDDEVRRYVPELPDFGVPVTIRQLLHHTSGLRDYFGLLALRGWREQDTLSVRGFLDLVSRQQALNFRPGARHLYSNTGYVLLAQVVERVSGQSLRAYSAARIFGPLRMTGSEFRDHHTVPVAGAATGYEPSGTAFKAAMPNFDVVGDGGLFTTVQDLARWEGVFVFPRSDLREAAGRLGERGVLAKGDSIPYAMGLQHGLYRGAPTLAHSGAYAGFRAAFTRFPHQRFSVAVLCNRADANPSQLSRQVADIYLDRSLAGNVGKVPLDTTAPGQADLTGVYWNEETETAATASVTEGRLLVTIGGTASTLMRADAGFPESFVAAATGTRYRFDVAGMLTIARPLWPVDAYTRTDSARVTGAALGALVGRYDSAELGAQLVVTPSDSVLQVRWESGMPTPLRPLFGYTFLGAGGLVVRFAADGSRLTISNGRTQRVAFVRVR